MGSLGLDYLPTENYGTMDYFEEVKIHKEGELVVIHFLIHVIIQDIKAVLVHLKKKV